MFDSVGVPNNFTVSVSKFQLAATSIFPYYDALEWPDTAFGQVFSFQLVDWKISIGTHTATLVIFWAFCNFQRSVNMSWEVGVTTKSIECVFVASVNLKFQGNLKTNLFNLKQCRNIIQGFICNIQRKWRERQNLKQTGRQVCRQIDCVTYSKRLAFNNNIIELLAFHPVIFLTVSRSPHEHS